MLNDETKKIKNMILKKKGQTKESPKLGLIFQTHNPWNPRHGLN